MRLKKRLQGYNLGENNIMKKFLLIALTILMSLTFALAQTTTGRLNGTVSGPDGVLPNATITAKDTTTGKTQTTTSKDDGTFLFTQVEFGTYTVTVAANGFKTFVANDVKIDVGRDYSLNPALEIGNIQETVTVTAGADVVTSTSAQVSNTISPQQILSLPLITRNPLSLTTLQAGVASNPFQNTSINGMRTTLTNITRDGINIQDTFIRTNATDFAPGRPSVDDTSEFTINTANQEADQGYGGAQIRLVTPRGTKDFHGALFAYNRNSAFGANNFFNNRSVSPTQPKGIPRPFRNRNQYGGKVSGQFPLLTFGEGTAPIFLKDRAFFFLSYEGIRDPVSAFATRTILTPSARTGAFQYTRALTGAAINTTINGATVTCPAWAATADPAVTCSISNLLAFGQSVFGASNIASTVIDPTIQSRVLSLLPTTSNFSGGDSLNTAGYGFNRDSSQRRRTITTREDFDLTEKDTVNVVYSWNSESNMRPDADTTKFTVTPGVVQLSTNKTFVLAYRRIFSSNIVNEARGGIFTSEVPFNRTDGTPSYFLSGLAVTNPENTFLSQGRNTKGFNYQDNVDWVVGSHSFRFGGQLQFFKIDSYNDAAIVPVYNVGTSSITTSPLVGTTLSTTNFAGVGGINTTQIGTANSLLALFGGIVNGGSSQFNVTDLNSGFKVTRLFQPFRYSNHSAYFSDRWTIARGLTASMGLRYELFPGMRLATGLALEPLISDPNNVIPSLLSTTGTYVGVGANSGKPNQYYKTDYNNFAPSLGIAFTPNFESGFMKFLFGAEGKSVIRAGYSQTYGNDSIVTSINNAAAGNVGLARTGSNAIGPLGNTTLNDRLSGALSPINPPTFITPPRTYLQNNSAAVAGNFGTVFAIDPNLQVPRIDQYSLGFQRELGNTAFEVRYIGSRSKNLVRGIDLNQIDIFSNGVFADFQKATANRTLSGTAFCNPTTVVGCQALSVFRSSATATATTVGGASAGAGTLLVGTGGLSATTFNNALIGGTPADLAVSFITGGFNNHPTVALPSATPYVKLLPNPATGAVDLMLNDGQYFYNSLQLEVRRRFSKGLYLQGNYTFSKNLTNAVGTSQALFEPYLDNNNKDLDYQLADFDQAHTFNFNGIYQLPFGKGKTFLNEGSILDKIVGGWEISGIAQWGTGSPITFTDARGTLNRAGRSGRQTPVSALTNDQIRALSGVFEQNGNIYFIDPSILLQTLNTATGRYSSTASQGFGSTPFTGQAFFSVNPGQTGNIGRALIRGPRTFVTNMALLKNVRFGETMRFQLRAEAFNVLNNTRFFNNTQFASITATNFGQITSAGTPREMQFALRFEF